MKRSEKPYFGKSSCLRLSLKMAGPPKSCNSESKKYGAFKGTYGFPPFLATCDLLVTDLRFATCDLRLATCDLRLATCDLRLATCDLRLATCDLRLATYGNEACGVKVLAEKKPLKFIAFRFEATYTL